MLRDHALFFLLSLSFYTCCNSLNVHVRQLNGTQFDPDGLTDKQLGILRYLARQTVETWNSTDPWRTWFVDKNQDTNAAIRYTLAGMGYAVAVAAERTPAYNQLYSSLLENVIQRMVSLKVWHYVDMFEMYRQQPTYPDPVAYKNIMYSGHLAQLLSLYESVSGNNQFNTRGWSFRWNDTVHFKYNTSKLFDAIVHQSHLYDTGGVPCEPHSIFIICNNFPHNAFTLYDTMHNTSYAARTNPHWQQTVMKYGRAHSAVTNNYFQLDKLFLDDKHPNIGTWVAVASLGSDAWALAWMRPWWNETTDPHANFLWKGWSHMYNSKRWRTDKRSNGTYIKPNEIGGLFTFPYGEDVSTSFYPMIEKQYFKLEPQVNSVQPKTEEVLRWFEHNYGTGLDLDKDGRTDAYMYKSSEHYHDWSTANLLNSYVMPPIDSEPGFLRGLFRRQQPLYVQHNKYPFVDTVQFPMIMIKSATFDSKKEQLHFATVLVDAPAPNTNTHVVQLGWGAHYRTPKKAMCDGKAVPLSGKKLRLPLPPWEGQQQCIVMF